MELDISRRLNLGCGPTGKMHGYINIDNRKCVNPDVVLDIEQDGLKPWEDNTVDEVRAFEFLEHIHIGQTVFVIEEIWRVLKHDGKFEHFTPSTHGFGAFQDPTHVSFWNPNSWLYFCNDAYRALYDIKAKFAVDKLEHRETSKEFFIYHTYGLMRAIKQ